MKCSAQPRGAISAAPRKPTQIRRLKSLGIRRRVDGLTVLPLQYAAAGRSAQPPALQPETGAPARPSPFLPRRPRHAGDLDPERAEARPRAEIDGLPVVAAEGQGGGVLEDKHDAAALPALRLKD